MSCHCRLKLIYLISLNYFQVLLLQLLLVATYIKCFYCSIYRHGLLSILRLTCRPFHVLRLDDLLLLSQVRDSSQVAVSFKSDLLLIYPRKTGTARRSRASCTRDLLLLPRVSVFAHRLCVLYTRDLLLRIQDK
jgi:hypothetical protein